jgi:nitrate/nitrite-specific signal transduction histidine kinase
MAKNGNSLDQRTFDKLRRLYIIGFSTIALSVLVSQILIRTHLSGQESDSTVINIAGRQRMLSQQLAKNVVSLSSTSSIEEQQKIKNNLKETLRVWEFSHHALQNGNDSLGLPQTNSDAISVKFAALNPVFDTIAKASKSIITKIENTDANSYTYINDVTIVKANEGAFLKQMDAIVNQYDAEAEEKVAWLRKLEFWLTILTLVILLGEFLFIFWPAAKSVRYTLAELLSAEKQAKQMAFDADELSKAREKSIQELSTLTRAMDETLLFARTLPDGTLVHMGNKFSRLFKFSNGKL